MWCRKAKYQQQKRVEVGSLQKFGEPQVPISWPGGEPTIGCDIILCILTCFIHHATIYVLRCYYDMRLCCIATSSMLDAEPGWLVSCVKGPKSNIQISTSTPYITDQKCTLLNHWCPFLVWYPSTYTQSRKQNNNKSRYAPRLMSKDGSSCPWLREQIASQDPSQKYTCVMTRER